MGRHLLAVSMALVLTMASGCATLVARKVSLPERLHGCDGHVKGFRYYVSRPHLVVSRQVPILQSVDYGVLVKAGLTSKGGKHPGQAKDLRGRWPGAPYAIQVITPTGAKTTYDTAGDPLPPDVASVHFNPVAGAGAGGGSSAPPLANLLGTSFADTSPTPPAAASIDAIQIAYLPDFEEQMAIRHINFLAHGKFALNFRDGWQVAVQSVKPALRRLAFSDKAAAWMPLSNSDKLSATAAST
jgi:hypothetical protein